MKGKLVRRGMAFGLALAMTIGLCACGGEDGKSMENASLAKEHVYRMQDIELPQEFQNTENGNTNILQTMHRDGKVMLLVQANSWDNITGESTSNYYLLSMNEDGSGQEMTEIQIPGQEESQGEEDASGGDESQGEEDAAGGDAPQVQPLEEEDAAVEDAPMAEAEVTVWENSYYGNFVLNAEGDLYGIRTYSRQESSAETYTSQNTYYLCRWDADGSFLWEKQLEGISADENTWLYVDTVIAGQDGTLTVLVRGDSGFIVTVDAEGNSTGETTVSEEAEYAFNNLERILVGDDGSLLAIYHDENDWQKTYCAELNLASGSLGESTELPSSVLYSWDYNVMNVGENNELIYTTSSGLYSYTLGAAEPELKMDYVNSDLYISSFYQIVPLSATSFLGVYREDWSSGMKAGVFTYVDPAEIQDKAVIVLAANYLDSDVKKRVIEFNRTSQEYRIVTKEYNAYNTYEDYTAGITRLNNDIITGNMPDILVNNEYNSLPIENYISKGLIADVGKLIENDEELSQVEFMQNVFDAYSVDGTLYYVVPNFEVYTMIAKESLVGDRTTWTMEDMQQVLATMGEDVRPFGSDTTREWFMNMVMRYCGNRFVDVATGKCSFNTDDFISMMEFANTLPEEIVYDDEYWNNYDWREEQSQYRDNRALLFSANLYHFPDIASIINGSFGEPVSFVGFPTENGNGSYLQSSTSYVLSARSKNLSGAWEFVRYYLTDEYQEQVNYFPVNRAFFEERSKEAMERPYWTDENGEKQYYDNTMYVNGEEIVIEPLSQEQLDQVVAFIESVNIRYYYNESVLNIVNEEMGAFYSGQKSAQDVADIIQRRIQIYVDENR